MQQVEIRIKGHIDRDWSDWISGSSVVHTDQGETALSGLVRDQAALYGLLSRLSDLGLQLSSVTFFPNSMEAGSVNGKGGVRSSR